MNILYVNSCVREESRTDRLAKKLLSKLGQYKEVKLDKEEIQPLDGKRLAERNKYIEEQDYSSSMFDYAKDFSTSDIIVISAPFWDLSFPSKLKVYIENIYVTGLVSKYNEEGIPTGLCRASKLYYVTTAGGKFDPAYSYKYIEDLALHYLGIQSVQLIKAEMLDVDGFDAEEILRNAFEEIDAVESW